MTEEFIAVYSKLTQEEREELSSKAKYKVDTLCPTCGGGLVFNPTKRGVKVSCSECKFKDTAKDNDIAPDLYREIMGEWISLVKHANNLLFEKYPGAKKRFEEMMKKSARK